MSDTPAAEIDIDVALVERLVAQQAPALAGLVVSPFASGWDNSIFSLGDDRLVRLPRRSAAVELVRHEHRWLPELAPRLPLRIPVPVVLGQPSDLFPWPWTVVEKVPGADALISEPEPGAAVNTLGEFFAAMHVAAPTDAPHNPHRGGPLAERDDLTRQRLADLEPWLDDHLAIGSVAGIRTAWAAAREAAPRSGPPVWIHGDVHPGNVVVADGAIVSVIDFGDLTSGDPATDLGAAWMFFDRSERDDLRHLLDADDDTWNRARGWAVSIALAIAANSADNPRYEALAARTLRNAADDAAAD